MKLLKLLAILLLLSGCTSTPNNELSQLPIDDSATIISKLKDDISELKELNNRYVSENDNLVRLLDIVNTKNNTELADSSIYILRHDPRLSRDTINEIRNKQTSEVASGTSSFYYEDEVIIDFEVSELNHYIAILAYNDDIQHLKLIKHDGTIIFNYDYNDFLSEFGDLTMNTLLWRIDGFDKEESVLWGNIGGELDIITYFVYNIVTDEFIIFDKSNYETYHDYLDKYPVVW